MDIYNHYRRDLYTYNYIPPTFLSFLICEIYCGCVKGFLNPIRTGITLHREIVLLSNLTYCLRRDFYHREMTGCRNRHEHSAGIKSLPKGVQES